MELNRSDADSVPTAKLSDPDTANNPLFRRYELDNSADILRASFISETDGFVNIDEKCNIKKRQLE